ncbi:MAG: rhodanese-like domain-containing protein [Candidatus Sericytochromatia bacterium]
MKFKLILLLTVLALSLPACKPDEEQKSDTKTGQTTQQSKDANKDQKDRRDQKDHKDQKNRKDDKNAHKNVDPNTGKPSLVKDLTPAEIKTLLAKHPEIVLIDVRNAKDFKNGHLEKAQNLDFRKRKDFDAKIKTFDKSKTYLLYGYKGKRSDRAAARMEKQGFKNLFALKGAFEELQAQGLATKK